MWRTTNWREFVPNHPEMMEEIGLIKSQISPQNGYSNVPAFQLFEKWEAGVRAPWRRIDSYFSELASTEGGLEKSMWETACQCATSHVSRMVRIALSRGEAMAPLARSIRDRERYTDGAHVHQEWLGPQRVGQVSSLLGGS